MLEVEVAPTTTPAGPSVRPDDVVIQGISKSYDGQRSAVDNVSLKVEPGTFVSLLGPSGCGKTTTLRMIAGLERPDRGIVKIAGETVYSHKSRENIPPHRRRVGFVFQSYALWPHMSVAENLAYPLKRAGVPKKAIPSQVLSTLETLQCTDLLNRYPGELSGGQQQRVALGRALVNTKNKVVLFDEPLSNLDAKLRDELRYELRRLQEDLGFTAIYVTHDQQEALAMSDTVVIMKAGQIERQGRPQDVFNNPHTAYVARFLGDYNVLDITGGRFPLASGEEGVVNTAIGPVTVITGSGPRAGTAKVAIPIGSLQLSPGVESDNFRFGAEVAGVAYYGTYSEVTIRADSGCILRCRISGHQTASRGDRIQASVVTNGVLVSDDE